MNNELIRHLLATMYYRFQKVEKYADSNFGKYIVSENCRKPKEILYHINDVLNKTILFVEEKEIEGTELRLLDFVGETDRFKMLLKRFDEILVSKKIDNEFSKKLIQGPITDIFCHIGQLSMLCGLNGSKIPAESFFKADIKTGEFN